MAISRKERIETERAIAQQKKEIERAKNLFVSDSSTFLNLIEHLFSSDSQQSEAEFLFAVAKKQYPGSLVQHLSKHLEESQSEPIRLHCATLLHRLLLPNNTLYAALFPTIAQQLKTTLCTRSGEEDSVKVHEVLMSIFFFYLCEVLLPKDQWPEIYNSMFQPLLSNENTGELRRAVILFVELIPRCPVAFLSRVDCLSEAFKKVMDMGKGGHEFSVDVSRAMMALIVHLTAPASHEKYYDLTPYIMKALSDAVVVMDDILIRKVLEGMIVLAGMQCGVFAKEIDHVVEKMLDIVQDENYVKDKTKDFVIELWRRIGSVDVG